MKLSPAQQRIIDRLRDGWILRSSDSSAWLSRIVDNKLETITVNGASVHRLYKLGLLNFERKYTVSTWTLREELEKP